MDERVKQLLEKNLAASEESLKILKKIYRDVLWRRIFGTAKFAVVVGLLIFGYLKVQPFIAEFLGTYEKILKPTSDKNINVDGNVLSPEITNLIRQFSR